MNALPEEFRGKRVVVMGLGLLGRGLGDAEFLAGLGAEVLVTDKKGEAELAESVARLKEYPNISFKLGGHDEEDFRNADYVLKAAGVPLGSPYIAAAKAAGVPVLMSTALFARHTPAAVVGVTGTRGKSTVTYLIHHALTGVGRAAHLGGNIRGISTLALLPETRVGEYAVLELDSWQLQGFGDLKISPHIAVFTNLMPDHLNYYPDMEAYFADKANIFRYQKPGDTLVAGEGIAPRIRAAHPPATPTVPAPLPEDWRLMIPGAHNRENAALARGALLALGLTDADIRAGLESFPGVPGRLELVREVRGVKIYNDTNATTPAALAAALAALDPEHARNILLIAGGADKGLDVSIAREAVHAHAKRVFFLSGSGTDRVRGPGDPVFNSLKEAVEAAYAAAQAGDIILLSPAFASFGMFTNEYDRGDQFNALVRKLT